MKKSHIGTVAVGLMLLGLFAAPPAHAWDVGGGANLGKWQAKGTSFTVPSNWKCSSTVSSPTLAAQACVVRNQNAVQAATIVRNKTNALQIVTSKQMLRSLPNQTIQTLESCRPSGVAANSISVCFTSTIQSITKVQNSMRVEGQYSTVTGSGYWY